MLAYWLHLVEMAGRVWPVPPQWVVLGQTLSGVWVQILMIARDLRDTKNLGLLQCPRQLRSSAASASHLQKGRQAVVRRPCSRLLVVVGHSGRYCFGRVTRGREARGCSGPFLGLGEPLRAEMGPGRPALSLLSARIGHL